MMYISLYLTFVKIGILSFGGGYATLPLIQKYIVEQNQWINMDTMMDIVSISQMTPGPIAINSATFVGNKIAGLTGGIIATLGVVTPQIIILSIFLFFIGTKNKYVKRVLPVINIAVIGLILVASISLFKTALINNLSFITISLFIITAYLSLRKVSVIKIIIISGIVGGLSCFV